MVCKLSNLISLILFRKQWRLFDQIVPYCVHVSPSHYITDYFLRWKIWLWPFLSLLLWDLTPPRVRINAIYNLTTMKLSTFMSLLFVTFYWCQGNVIEKKNLEVKWIGIFSQQKNWKGSTNARCVSSLSGWVARLKKFALCVKKYISCCKKIILNGYYNFTRNIWLSSFQ